MTSHIIDEHANIRADVYKLLNENPLVIGFGVPVRERPYRIRVTIHEEADLEEAKRSILASIGENCADLFRFELGRPGTLLLR